MLLKFVNIQITLTLFLSDEDSKVIVFNLMQIFVKYSGLKLNLNKTQIMAIWMKSQFRQPFIILLNELKLLMLFNSHN